MSATVQVCRNSCNFCSVRFLNSLKLVDPSIQSLNRFTDNMGKAEALTAEIASILRESGHSNKSLITKDESPWLANRTAPVRSPRKGHASSKKRRAKLLNGAAGRDE